MSKIDDESVDTPVWGAAAIGAVINRTPRSTFHMLERGALPAKKVNGRWVSTPRRLRERILGDDGVAHDGP